MNDTPDSLGLIAGRGSYPLELARSAKRAGVARVAAFAFKGETDASIERLADETHWLNLGRLGRLLSAVARSGVRHVILAGQIKPTHLFHLRMDKPMLRLLAGLKRRNAKTIFGALCRELEAVGVELLPAWRFMEHAMPAPGRLSAREPSAQEQADIELGLRIANATTGLQIGQTVVVKEGTVLAVEAFEGTNDAIRRAGRLGGPGAVVVKMAGPAQDMRFDLPVVGPDTLKLLRKIKASVLAVEAKRTILLECERLVAAADRMGLSLVAVEGGSEI